MALSSLAADIARRILKMVGDGELGLGAHLREAELAKRFLVSRSPLREALHALAGQRIIRHELHRGCFIADVSKRALERAQRSVGDDDANATYREIAALRLDGKLPEHFTEADIGRRFGLKRPEVGKVVERMAHEGWIERRPGYGWRFVPILATPASFELGYRYRIIIEPAGILEPTFVVDREAFARCRAEHMAVLESRLRRADPIEVFRVGSSFHEMLARCSGNPFFHDAVLRLNKLRRLIEYRAMIDTKIFIKQAEEHVAILDLAERGERSKAADLLRQHLDMVGSVKLKELKRSEKREREERGSVPLPASLHF